MVKDLSSEGEHKQINVWLSPRHVCLLEMLKKHYDSDAAHLFRKWLEMAMERLWEEVALEKKFILPPPVPTESDADGKADGKEGFSVEIAPLPPKVLEARALFERRLKGRRASKAHGPKPAKKQKRHPLKETPTKDEPEQGKTG